MIQFECVYGNKKDFNKYVQSNKSKETLVVDWSQVKYKLKKNDPYDSSPSDYIISVTIAGIINSAIKSKRPPTRIIYLIQNFESNIILNLKDFINNLNPCWFKLVLFSKEIDMSACIYFDEIEEIKYD